MQTLISKIGMALSAFVTLIVLGSFGYDPNFLSAFQAGLKDKVFDIGAGGQLLVDPSFDISQLLDNSGNPMTLEKLQAGYADVCKGTWMATTLLCGLSMFACVIPLFFYTFTEKKQAEAVARIEARKAAAAEATALQESDDLLAGESTIEDLLESAEVQALVNEEIAAEEKKED